MNYFMAFESHKWMYMIVLFVALVALYIMLRVINKTKDELTKSTQKLQDIFDTLDVAIWSHDMLADRYQSLVEMSPDIIAVISKGEIDYINKAGCKLFGASIPEELLGLSIEGYIPDRIIKEMKDREENRVIAEVETIMYEFSVKRLDGMDIDVEM